MEFYSRTTWNDPVIEWGKDCIVLYFMDGRIEKFDIGWNNIEIVPAPRYVIKKIAGGIKVEADSPSPLP